MEQIRLFDWCRFENSNRRENFVEEVDLDNSVTERLIRNTFKDPLLPEYEDEGRPIKVNWADIFKNKNLNPIKNNIYVPGLQAVPKYPKLSLLTNADLLVITKMLVPENPLVMPNFGLKRPNKSDQNRYLEIKETYEKEQKEYISWGKTMWHTVDSIKAIRPHKVLETVYDAIFEYHLNMVFTYPRNFEMASMVELRECDSVQFEMSFQKTLINVPISELPEADCPSLLEKFTIYKNKPKLPKSCMKHPCRFVLPKMSVESEVDLNDLHQELGIYALENDIKCIVSEEALCCLLELNRYWMIPVSVRPTVTANGSSCNTFVIGSEIYNRRLPARYRTHAAMQYLLHSLLIKDSHKESQASLCSKDRSMPSGETQKSTVSKRKASPSLEDDDSDDSEEEGLVIDFDEMLLEQNNEDESQKDDDGESEESPPVEQTFSSPNPPKRRLTEDGNIPKLFKNTHICTCKDSPPLPRRSYKVWRFDNKSIGHSFEAIIHSPHRCKMNDKELLIEPIAEYQLELGATCQNEYKLRSLALSLFLRSDSNLVNVRIDPTNGDLVHYEYLNLSELISKYNSNVIDEAANILYTTLSQLQRLLPGQYLLQHEPNIGANARLHVLRPLNHTSTSVIFDNANVPVPHEVELTELSVPPTLCPLLLPMNKYRKIPPLAFSANELWVAKVVEQQKKTNNFKRKKNNRRNKKK